ncbi:hypothetical protein [Neptunomonas sp.]|uniref:hypothetical protein n=1 Tax=Neptunomonas sp. TaxID=1971898 RepID=UPI00356139F0
MRITILSALIFFGTSGICFAESQIDDVWEYLTKKENSSQWAVISIEGNRGFLQCERYDEYLRCPFPVWAKLLPSAKFYAPISVQTSPYPEVEGTETKLYMEANQVKTLISLLSEKKLEYAEVYSQLEDEKGAVAGTSYDVVLILDLDYAKFENLVNEFLNIVWGAGITGDYQIETDS